jgi:hypothetical protein
MIDLQVQRCHFQTGDERWVVERFGPLLATSFDWLNLWYAAFEELRGADVAITGSMLIVTDDFGRMVKMPPLHLHHSHLWHKTQDLPFFHYIGSESHADGQCAEYDGEKCQMQNLPAGHGILAKNGHLFFDGVINYVEEVVPGAIWFDTSVRLASTPVELVFQYGLGIRPVDWWQYSRVGSMELPADSSGSRLIFWSTTRILFGMRILWWKWHVHQQMTEDLYIVHGAPQVLEELPQTVLPSMHPITPHDAVQFTSIAHGPRDPFHLEDVNMRSCYTNASEHHLDVQALKHRILQEHRLFIQTHSTHRSLYDYRPFSTPSTYTLKPGDLLSTVAVTRGEKRPSALHNHAALSLLYARA